jgi:hypothetical protein
MMTAWSPTEKMPLPFQLHGIVHERVQRGLQHFVPRAGVERAPAGEPIAREFDRGAIDVERELHRCLPPVMISAAFIGELKTQASILTVSREESGSVTHEKQQTDQAAINDERPG